MNPVRDLAFLEELLGEFLNEAPFTNNYMLLEEMEKHIAKSGLFYQREEQGLVLLVDRQDFFRAYYYLKSLDHSFPLQHNRPVVQELIYRGPKHFPTEEVDFWLQQGFTKHLGRDAYFLKASACDTTVFDEQKLADLRYLSSSEHLLQAEQMIRSHLDPYTGDMLSLEDLAVFAARQELYGLFEGERLMAVLQAELKNKVYWLGHMVVDGAYRGRGLSKILLHAYLRDGLSRQCRQFQLWVIDDNAPALGLYQGHGFSYLNKSTLSLLKI